MMVHRLNPLLDLGCKLTMGLENIIKTLTEYISKGRDIESVIGYKNEIKIAPEMKLLDEDIKTSKHFKESHQVLVWSQETSKGLILNDIYVLLNFHEPLYLYYYWDEIEAPNKNMAEEYYYRKEKSKDELLGMDEYEDFIKMVSKVVENVLDKKRRKRLNRKRHEPEADKNPHSNKIGRAHV